MEKLIRFVLPVLAVLLSATASAQDETSSSVCVKVGTNVASLTNEPSSKVRMGFTGGLELLCMTSERFGLSVGALYSQQGGKLKLVSRYTEDNYYYTLRLDYVNIPLLCNLYISKGFAVKAGFQLGIKVKGELPEPERDDDYNYGINSVPKVSNTSLSIPLGLSYEFHNVVLDARYNVGLSRILNDYKDKMSVFSFTLGYIFGK